MSDQRVGIDINSNGDTLEDKFQKSKMYNFTKSAIVVITVVVLIVGILGSMRIGVFSDFSMNDFVSFINAYQGMFITLTGSISIGGIAKNYFKAKSEEKDNSKFIATGG